MGGECFETQGSVGTGCDPEEVGARSCPAKVNILQLLIGDKI